MNRAMTSEATTTEKAARYDTLMPLLQAMFREFQDLAKKKPDGNLSKRKVEIVNRLLKDLISVLEGEPSRGYLDMLDDVELPQNSDVVLILGQFVAAMASFHSKYRKFNHISMENHWVIKKG
jgi:hypothetical protein